MPNTRPAPFCACAALVLLVVHAHQTPPTIHADTCTAGRAVAESARGSGDVFSLPLALLDPLLSPSQGSHTGPEGLRESGVFAFCPSVRRHECREQPLRQQQAPRRALSRAIPVVNAQRSGSTHAQSEAPARPVSHYSFESVGFPRFRHCGRKSSEMQRFRLLRKVNGPAQHAIKGHAGSTNALNKVDGTRRRKNGQDSIRLFCIHVILSPLHRLCNGIRLLRKPIKGHAGSANAKQGRWHATPIP